MTPEAFRAIRQRAGLSQARLAALLRIGDLRTIRRYETGERPIPGPVSLLMEMIDRGALRIDADCSPSPLSE
jgi:transcriptional regulator with XRE-family HTH domain